MLEHGRKGRILYMLRLEQLGLGVVWLLLQFLVDLRGLRDRKNREKRLRHI